MISDFLYFVLKLCRGALVVFGVHYLFNYFGPFPLSDSLFYKIHLFNFLASLLMYPIVIVAFHKMYDLAGFAFLTSSVFKMLISLAFLVPFVLPKTASSQNFALQFCVVFVSYLVFECAITIRKLND
jgi:hypothetical protein